MSEHEWQAVPQGDGFWSLVWYDKTGRRNGIRELLKDDAEFFVSLNALQAEVTTLRALVSNAYSMVECYDPVGTGSDRKQIEARRREQQEWLERADALTTPEREEKP